MKKIQVNAKNYALFEYEKYHNDKGDVIKKPKKLTYDIGDVVYIKKEKAIGVVLGCIGEETQELRTDMSGMVCYTQIRLAERGDFKKGVKFDKRLLSEIQAQWVVTDSDDNNQQGRQITDVLFEFKDDITEATVIDVSGFTNGEIEGVINGYGYTLHKDKKGLQNIHKLYENEANWIIAECMFEQGY